MSHSPRLTLIGMYEYDREHLFDGLTLPDEIDKDTFIKALLLSVGERQTVYSSLPFMKFAIELWGKKWHDNMLRIVAAVNAEYNPVHNFDRTEQYTDTETGTSTGTGTSSGSNENKVSAYNSDTYQPSDQSANTATTNQSATSNRNTTHSARLYGNIGVTKSQEMVDDEIELRKRQNVYDIIIDLFARDLLLYIY